MEEPSGFPVSHSSDVKNALTCGNSHRPIPVTSAEFPADHLERLFVAQARARVQSISEELRVCLSDSFSWGCTNFAAPRFRKLSSYTALDLKYSSTVRTCRFPMNQDHRIPMFINRIRHPCCHINLGATLERYLSVSIEFFGPKYARETHGSRTTELSARVLNFS